MREVRGVDIHLPAVCDSDPKEGKRQLRSLVRRAKDKHLNFLRPFVVDTRSGACYDSQVVPVRLYPQWDPLEVIVEEAHGGGLEVHPFVCVAPLGEPHGPTKDPHTPGPVIREHPDWATVDKEGRASSWGEPGHPGFRGYVTSVFEELLGNYELDGISLDYARYAGTGFGYSADNREAFRGQHGVDPVDIAEDDAAMQEAWQAFRVNLVTELVGEVVATVRRVGPKTIVSAYVWTDQDPKVCLRDWTQWLRRGYLDAINPTGYLYDEQAYRERCTAMRKVCQEARPGIPVFVNVGVATSHGKLRGPREVIRWSQIAREEGMGMSYFTWSALKPWLDEVAEALFAEEAELPWGGWNRP